MAIPGVPAIPNISSSSSAKSGGTANFGSPTFKLGIADEISLPHMAIIGILVVAGLALLLKGK